MLGLGNALFPPSSSEIAEALKFQSFRRQADFGRSFANSPEQVGIGRWKLLREPTHARQQFRAAGDSLEKREEFGAASGRSHLVVQRSKIDAGIRAQGQAEQSNIL